MKIETLQQLASQDGQNQYGSNTSQKRLIRTIRCNVVRTMLFNRQAFITAMRFVNGARLSEVKGPKSGCVKPIFLAD